MDPIRNPYAPGAGTQPPELAGRDSVRDQVHVALSRLRIGRAAKSIIMVGLRGVGKTVLLDKMRADAESQGIVTARAETQEGRSLPALIAPQLRAVLLHLSRMDRAKDAAGRGLRVLAGFVKAFKVKFHDIEIALDYEPEVGTADNGDLESDLSALFEQAGRAAKSAGTVIALFIDEIQYIEEPHFAALISALHRCAQLNLPVTMVGAGLPQLRGLAGDAKSYAERLFDFPMIGPLTPDEARLAIAKPALEEGVEYTSEAIAGILERTRGYPYFLQEWGKHSWNTANATPIDANDVVEASAEALASLDESFFRVRYDRLKPTEKRYLRAMAELGPGPHRSGEIALALGKTVNSLGPLRQGLIAKGMLWSPNHGDTAFTVPLFDEFMKRVMPAADWKNELL